jgi:membrane protein YqaA with SNARE-associated domain
MRVATGAPATDTDDLDLQELIRRVGVGLVVLLIGVAILAVVAKEPLEAAAHGFVDAFGLVGVFVGVLMTDTFVLTHEPILFVGYAGGLGFWPVFVTASVASVSAGFTGWSLGSMLGRFAPVQRLFERYRIRAFLEKYGFWSVAVAALTPFPFSVATWASGAAGVSLKTVMLGSLFRVPKVLFYFGVIIAGWGLAG